MHTCICSRKQSKRIFKFFETKYEHLNIICKDFLIYFEKVYLGNAENFDEDNSPYPIKFWNVYEREIKNIPRTINCLEAWHRGFNKNAEICHPNIAKLIDCMHKE
ncbi:hypothetical protein DMUE_4860, partial [Dictyocoela muelleri]